MLRVLQKFNTFIHDPSSHFTENLQVTVVCQTFTNLGITKGSHLAAMKDADARWCKGICGDTMFFEAGPGHNMNKLPFASSGPGLKPTRLQSHCSIQSDDSLKNASISIFRRWKSWSGKQKPSWSEHHQMKSMLKQFYLVFAHFTGRTWSSSSLPQPKVLLWSFGDFEASRVGPSMIIHDPQQEDNHSFIPATSVPTEPFSHPENRQPNDICKNSRNLFKVFRFLRIPIAFSSFPVLRVRRYPLNAEPWCLGISWSATYSINHCRFSRTEPMKAMILEKVSGWPICQETQILYPTGCHWRDAPSTWD